MYIDLTNKDLNIPYDFEIISKGDNGLFEGRNIEFINQLEIKGTYEAQKDRVDVKATLEFSVKAACDRCLKVVKKHYEIPVQENFYKDEEDPELFSYTNDKVYLDNMINEKILFNLGQKILCKDNCKGICPVCGCDLNKTQCSCKTETDEKNPFAILKSIVGGAKNGGTKK